MRENKKEPKKFVSSKAGQAITKRILVAEDDNAIQDTISKLLKALASRK